ncbi:MULTISPECIES: hypothetical protein [unclassified Streptomyces]|uniref:hypothetical protein n=1 Tax=unclassified Streptomyces TaxID=2593676 RepID=UPI00362C38CC
MILSPSTTFQPVLERVTTEIAQTPARWWSADHVPALPACARHSFGMAVAALDGPAYGVWAVAG